MNESDDFNFEEDERNIKEIDKGSDVVTKIIDVDDYSNNFDKIDVNSNIKYAIISYIGPLFIIPLVKGLFKKSKYVLFHINQGLNLFLIEIISILIVGLLNSVFYINNHIPGWLSIINFLVYLLIVVLILLGIINSSNGKSKELPIIGKYRFIK